MFCHTNSDYVSDYIQNIQIYCSHITAGEAVDRHLQTHRASVLNAEPKDSFYPCFHAVLSFCYQLLLFQDAAVNTVDLQVMCAQQSAISPPIRLRQVTN